MKVLQIITGLAMGGAEKVVVDLCAQSLNNHNYEFQVVSLIDEMDRKPELDSYNIPVVSLGISKNLFSFMKGIEKLHQLLKREKPDLIHCHMFHAYIVTIIAAKRLKIPLVFTPHSTFIGGKWREFLLLITKNYRKYDIIFNEDQQNFFHKNSPYTVTIPNGIDIKSFQLAQKGIKKNDVFTFLNVGNLEIEKNQVALIHFANQLKSKGYKFEIKIVGEGSKKEDLYRSIEQFQLTDTVHLLGKRFDVPRLMASSHCYVLPSLWEGMPITILEAGVARLPIIATPVGNIPTIISKDRGSVAALENFAEEMSNMMDNYKNAQQKSENLLQFIVKNYSIESTFQNHIRIYQESIRMNSKLKS